MKFIYPAIIQKTPSGTFRAVFPDLACCEAQGDTLEDAVDAANEAAYNWIELELSEEGAHLPPVSDVSDLKLSEGETVRRTKHKFIRQLLYCFIIYFLFDYFNPAFRGF